MDMRVPEYKDSKIKLKWKRLIVSISYKKSFNFANNCVAAIRIIYGSVYWYHYIYAYYNPTNVQAIAIPIDNLFVTALNIEGYEDTHKYTNDWHMLHLDDKIGNFAVNSTINFDDVDLLEVFIE